MSHNVRLGYLFSTLETASMSTRSGDVLSVYILLLTGSRTDVIGYIQGVNGCLQVWWHPSAPPRRLALPWLLLTATGERPAGAVTALRCCCCCFGSYVCFIPQRGSAQRCMSTSKPPSHAVRCMLHEPGLGRRLRAGVVHPLTDPLSALNTQLAAALPSGWLADKVRRDWVLRLAAVIGATAGAVLLPALPHPHVHMAAPQRCWPAGPRG